MNACGGVSTCNFTVTVNCPPPSPIINVTQSNGSLVLTWPSGQGLKLQYQTNSLNSSTWTTLTGVPDGSYTITVDLSRPVMFFRLKFP
jgi:hypothetical protein